MELKLQRKLEEVCLYCEISQETLIQFVQEEWVSPCDREHFFFDEEDVARIKLIKDLKAEFGVNDEGVSIILHLLDQLNLLGQKTR